MAKTKHVPTERDQRMVQMMVAGGIIYDDIAAALGIGRTTLKTHYKKELKAGGIIANAMVVANLYRHAAGNSPERDAQRGGVGGEMVDAGQDGLVRKA